MKGMKQPLQILAALALVSSPALAENQRAVLVRGQLLAGAELAALDGVRVAVNGVPAVLAADGSYVAQLPQSEYYRITATGEPVFTMVQTFGGQELSDPACACLRVPGIELVARRPGRVELFFGGDVMAGRRFFEAEPGQRPVLRRGNLAEDLGALLKPMQPYFESADFASVNLETVLADEAKGGALKKRITFYSPTALAEALRAAGIDYVSTGNNHIYDFQEPGLASTLAALDRAGLYHSGAGRTVPEAAQAKAIDLGANRLALLGFVGTRGYSVPNLIAEPGKGGAMLGTDGSIARGVRAALAENRAAIVQLHTGTEYADEPNEGAVRRMRRAIDEGAALVVSHHPHVPQGIELYNNRVIAYSLGNFLFDQDIPETMATFTLKVWMEQGRVIRAEAIPIQTLDYRPVPSVGAMRESLLRRLFALSARRGTRLRMSGGHAVVALEQAASIGAPACDPAAQTARLRFILAAPQRPCPNLAQGAGGRDLLMRGDFENAQFGAARDRTWRAYRASWALAGEPGGNRYLSLLPTRPGNEALVFQHSYLKAAAGGRFSLFADVRVSVAASLNLVIKDKPVAAEGNKPTPAWRGTVVGAVQVPATPGWHRVRIDFERNGDPAATLPLRPTLALRFADPRQAQGQAFALDNVQLVEWSKGDSEADRWLWTHWQAPPAAMLADR